MPRIILYLFLLPYFFWTTRARAPAPHVPCLAKFFAYRFALAVQIKIVGAAGFGIRAGHVEPAEGVRAHDCARAFAVDVEVADMKLADSTVDLLLRIRVYGAGQAEFRVIGDFEGM